MKLKEPTVGEFCISSHEKLFNCTIIIIIDMPDGFFKSTSGKSFHGKFACRFYLIEL